MLKVEIIEEGQGQLVGFRDPDENRSWVLDNKSRTPEDKRMSAQEAVSKFIKPGDKKLTIEKA